MQALTWMVDMVDKGYSPKNVGQDADYIALQNGQNAFNWQRHLAGQRRVQGLKNLEGFGATAAADRGEERRLGGLAPVRAAAPDRADQNKVTASKYFIKWISEQLDRRGPRAARCRLARRAANSAEFKAMKARGHDRRRGGLRALPAGGGGHRRRLTAVLRPATNAAILRKAEPASSAQGLGAEGQPDPRGQPEEVRRLIVATAARPAGGGARRGRVGCSAQPARSAGRGGHAVSVPGAVPGAVPRVRAAAGRVRHLDQPARLGLPAAGQAVRRPAQLHRPVHARARRDSGDFWKSMRATGIFTVLQRAVPGRRPARRGVAAQPGVPRPDVLPGGLLRAVRAGRGGGRRALCGSCSTRTSAW